MDKATELKRHQSTMKRLPLDSPDLIVMTHLCPHLNKLQIKSILDSELCFFAIPKFGNEGDFKIAFLIRQQGSANAQNRPFRICVMRDWNVSKRYPTEVIYAQEAIDYTKSNLFCNT